MISTYDGTAQPMHPDVLDLGGRFAGARYWMAMTPYPYGDDRRENPSIRVSRDGVAWETLLGAPDPVVAPPADPEYHNADADLAYDGRTLFLYYLTRSRVRPHVMISVRRSDDGRIWSEPRVVMEQEWGVSPAAVLAADGWRLYYVHADLRAGASSFHLRCRRGTRPDSLPRDERCTLEIAGHHLWHVDMIEHRGGAECLAAAFPRGTDPSRCSLFHATSTDGMHFEVSRPAPLVRPSRFGWDDRMIYRSSFVREATGEYKIWYTGASWGMRFGIGVLEGPLDALRPGSDGGSWAPRAASEYVRDLLGIAKYAVLRTVPRSLLVRLRPSLRDASDGAGA